jgi:hypothetical protein
MRKKGDGESTFKMLVIFLPCTCRYSCLVHAAQLVVIHVAIRNINLLTCEPILRGGILTAPPCVQSFCNYIFPFLGGFVL